MVDLATRTDGCNREIIEGLSVRSKRSEYAAPGSTREEIRTSVSLLGPMRNGARYVAYTDWEVTWHFRRECTGELWRAVGVRVVVQIATITPRWLQPDRADPSLFTPWRQYCSALLEHERGHHEIAEKAGENVLHALYALAPQPDVERLNEAVEKCAVSVLEIHRGLERDYDRETIGGKTQGCSF